MLLTPYALNLDLLMDSSFRTRSARMSNSCQWLLGVELERGATRGFSTHGFSIKMETGIPGPAVTPGCLQPPVREAVNSRPEWESRQCGSVS
jgi:hypothetical protein